ncbi:helix-turn-helix domain-containing protein [Cohnella ginsengisoli]|uniref:helix-turn-helix domain-containing protein n=1 Tax=Cohnella ginsengisoli TaxID=425004 RepID=UPI003B8A9632
MVLKLLGRRVRERRERLYFRQEELAELIGVTRSSVANIETGRQNVGIERLVQLADALGCDLSDLLPKIRQGGIRNDPICESSGKTLVPSNRQGSGRGGQLRSRH